MSKMSKKEIEDININNYGFILNLYDEHNQLTILKTILFNNTELNWSGEELKIGDSRAIMEYLKAIDKDRYNKRFEHLKNLKNTKGE